MKKCPKCNTKINDADIFCWQCGYGFEEELATSAISKDLEETKNSNKMISKELSETRDKLNKSNSEISKLKNELQNKDNEIKNTNVSEKNDTSGNNKELKAATKKINGLIIISVLIAIFLIISMVQCNNESRQARLLQEELNQANVKYSNLLESNRVHIDLLTVGNANADKQGRYLNWISKPGTRMYTKGMRVLNPEMRYTTELTDEVTFYIKIISPNGVMQGNNQPNGYSYAVTTKLKNGENVYLDLYGFGDVEKSIFQAGTYSVEVWYKDVCIKSKEFTIYE
jgi:hypothetical protein